ncbi:MAG: N5-carboxyaminoimidazole ribonucleotide synthase [Opitutia bacterium UBA7350]|nr:MAG: N5-carboxyaminoimidazole ribonucleotide synthase [Opitutae bacterium UBA7350]
MIPPGATIGILGGGQLGRMLILAGKPMGYRFHVYEPTGPCAAGQVADSEINRPYDDTAALRKFAEDVDVITLEFENIPAEVIETLRAVKPIFPGWTALHTCQHRQREKDFLKADGFPCAPFEYADSAESLETAVAAIDFPCVIKTAAFGYDGKGQVKLDAPAEDYPALWNELGTPPRVVVEKWIQHQGEFSVICSRRSDGATQTFPMAENVHVRHILHASILPARASEAVQVEAARLATALSESLEVVGLLAVEFFLDADGSLIINEMAPRPHNSGHYSIEGCPCSQFEQHLRAVCGLPFGDTHLLQPIVMINLLGDVWESGVPDWTRLLKDPAAKLHLYDKGEARPGRKMGHFSVTGESPEAALAAAEAHFKKLLN